MLNLFSLGGGEQTKLPHRPYAAHGVQVESPDLVYHSVICMSFDFRCCFFIRHSRNPVVLTSKLHIDLIVTEKIRTHSISSCSHYALTGQ